MTQTGISLRKDYAPTQPRPVRDRRQDHNEAMRAFYAASQQYERMTAGIASRAGMAMIRRRLLLAEFIVKG